MLIEVYIVYNKFRKEKIKMKKIVAVIILCFVVAGAAFGLEKITFDKDLKVEINYMKIQLNEESVELSKIDITKEELVEKVEKFYDEIKGK